jgi:hypothetical protein
MTEETTNEQCGLSPLPSTTTEVLATDSTRSLFEEVLDEVNTGSRDAAKAVIKERVLEIKRLEKLLAKAKADLQKLLEKDPNEIALF